MSLEEVKRCFVCKSEEFESFYTFDYSDSGLEDPFRLKRCVNCGMVLNSPRLSPEDSAALYETDYYVFDEATETQYREEANRDLRRVLAVSEPGDRLLEIGCARGHLLALAQELGYDVQGIEISAYASEAARASGLSVFTGTIEQTFFPESSFDVIVALDVIEHVHNPLRFLEIACRYLKKEGILILETPNVASIFGRLGGKRWIGFIPYHICLFSPLTLTRLCVKAGLGVVKLETTEAHLLSLDGARRLGLGSLLSPSVRRRMGSWFRRHKFTTGEIDVASPSDIHAPKKRRSVLARWLNTRQLGDQLVVLLQRSLGVR